MRHATPCGDRGPQGLRDSNSRRIEDKFTLLSVLCRSRGESFRKLWSCLRSSRAPLALSQKLAALGLLNVAPSAARSPITRADGLRSQYSENSRRRAQPHHIVPPGLVTCVCGLQTCLRHSLSSAARTSATSRTQGDSQAWVQSQNPGRRPPAPPPPRSARIPRGCGAARDRGCPERDRRR
jgi:hypothetical protein